MKTAGVAIIATAFCLWPVSAQDLARRIGQANLTVAGLTLGVSTDDDVERILGTVQITETPDHEGARRCYACIHGDGTILELESWIGTLIQFRIAYARPGTRSSCAKSALISSHLATGSGLKLGLPRKKVIAILGRPTRTDADRLTYEESFDRPLTPEERTRLREKGGPPWDVESVHVEGKIEIVLVKSKVVLIDVLHVETD